MVRHSDKRDAVLFDLQERYDHPTAEMVYQSVKEKYPSISLGTVYRNLEELCLSGEIIKIGAENKERYDGHTHPHSHFFCTVCGAVYDLNSTYNTKEIKSIAKEIDADIVGFQVSFRGICKNCKTKKSN